MDIRLEEDAAVSTYPRRYVELVGAGATGDVMYVGSGALMYCFLAQCLVLPVALFFPIDQR